MKTTTTRRSPSSLQINRKCSTSTISFDSGFHKLARGVRDLLGGNSFSASYANEVEAAAPPELTGNVALLMYGKQIAQPRSVDKEGVVLHYLGRDPKGPSLDEAEG